MRRDRISALFFFGLSLFISVQSVIIGLGSPDTPGPGMLPFCAGAGMGLLSLWLVTQAFRSKKAPNDVPGEGPFQWGKFSLVCICLFGYAIVVDWLGFVLTTFIVVLAFFHLFESTKGWFVVIKAALIAIGNYVFFVEGLGLSLPRGFLGW